ncbi:lytic transglycosylase [Bacteroidia bacterium]|nr:lytic transglycosylase [Bacteroidia bacterium]
MDIIKSLTQETEPVTSLLTDILEDTAVFVPLQEAFLTKYLTLLQKKDTGIINIAEQEIDSMLDIADLDSMYQARLKGLCSLFHIPYNKKIKSFIEVYTVKKRQQVSVMLSLSKVYFPIFEELLKKNNMPEDIKYLSVIESALNPRAGSNKGAMGLWQFMPYTGKMCYLEVNGIVDQRLDPVKSTEAAIVYLKQLYNIYGDWALSLAAYNCGPGNVNKAIRRANGKKDYWVIYNYLPRETRGYVPAFIGALYAMTYHNEHNIIFDETEQPDLTDVVTVRHPLTLSCIANQINIPLKTLQDFNPQYKKGFIPASAQKSYTLCLPVQYVPLFAENSDAMYEQTKRQQLELTKIVYYTVKPGDTLASICRRYPGISVSEVIALNNLKNSGNTIYANQVLKIKIE